MLYGIVMDTIRDGILRSYGAIMWKRIVKEVNLPFETFEFYSRYDDNLLIKICDCMIEILNDGTRDTYLEFFGTNFIHYFYRCGFDKILRVAGRTLRDFLFVIDELHDSNRYIFPQMKHPLFHVTEENEKGATLIYNMRHGLTHFAIGGLKAVASVIYNQNDIHVIVQHDFSTNDYSQVFIWVQFDNKNYKTKRLFNFPSLPDLSVTTFFQVFPFSILMNSSLRIHHMGKNIVKIFPDDTPLIGQLLNDVFQIIQPGIFFEWDKILSYGQYIVFMMENRLPLRIGSSSRIRLKGQMKYIQNKNMLWFLCHPVLEIVDDMISTGLHLTDLSLFDNTNGLLITGTSQQQQLEEITLRQNVWRRKASYIRKKLSTSHKTNQSLLYSTMPKHIARLLQSGVQVNSINECQPFVSIMFINVMDLKTLTDHLDATHAITYLNNVVILFDAIADKYDVFKVEIRADASYMAVAGIHDQACITRPSNGSQLSLMSSANGEEDDKEENDDQKKNLFELNSTEIIAALSLELLQASEDIHNPITNKPFDLKFGFHSGMAIGGIIGIRNYQYCLFGDTVKIASQMMTTGEVGRIHVSQTAYSHLVKDRRFTLEYRGQMNIEDSEPIDTFWLTGSTAILPTTKN
ncbi:unnamed protein product [Rotaria sordida]|uniref:guanylate cyclase n=2 Tax=Rotaria sordida TaxID=392033 RepID=A0A818HLR7_9BILA|nr:unnamed protein product [Rotaria sordida]